MQAPGEDRTPKRGQRAGGEVEMHEPVAILDEVRGDLGLAAFDADMAKARELAARQHGVVDAGGGAHVDRRGRDQRQVPENVQADIVGKGRLVLGRRRPAQGDEFVVELEGDAEQGAIGAAETVLAGVGRRHWPARGGAPVGEGGKGLRHARIAGAGQEDKAPQPAGRRDHHDRPRMDLVADGLAIGMVAHRAAPGAGPRPRLGMRANPRQASG